MAPLCSVLISCFALKNILQRELAAQSYAAYNGATYFMKSHLKFYSDPSELFFRIVHALKHCEFYISFMKSVQNNVVIHMQLQICSVSIVHSFATENHSRQIAISLPCLLASHDSKAQSQ